MASVAVSGDAVQPVQAALTAEHAAIWVYGLISAFVSNMYNSQMSQYITANRAARDATQRLLRDAGETPAAAEPAYQTPAAVTDSKSALAAIIAAEADVASTWCAVIDHTDDAALRGYALSYYTAAAVRATKWRMQAGVIPSAPAMPGFTP